MVGSEGEKGVTLGLRLIRGLGAVALVLCEFGTRRGACRADGRRARMRRRRPISTCRATGASRPPPSVPISGPAPAAGSAPTRSTKRTRPSTGPACFRRSISVRRAAASSWWWSRIRSSIASSSKATPGSRTTSSRPRSNRKSAARYRAASCRRTCSASSRSIAAAGASTSAWFRRSSICRTAGSIWSMKSRKAPRPPSAGSISSAIARSRRGGSRTSSARRRPISCRSCKARTSTIRIGSKLTVNCCAGSI